MKEFWNKIYSGLFRFKPLGRDVLLSSDSSFFPKLGLITNAQKEELENTLGIKINHIEFYEQALTHRSFLQVETERHLQSNERLEFLGDAVLGMIVADYLFSMHADLDEGELTKMRAKLVNKKSLAKFAGKFHLEKFIQLSYSAKKSIENGSTSITADAVEAILGALYLDRGIEETRRFIENTLIPAVMTEGGLKEKNYKSELLELVQAEGKQAPIYKVLYEQGPDHEKEFTVGVYIDNMLQGTGKGKSKKEAEQSAAKDALINKEIGTNN